MDQDVLSISTEPDGDVTVIRLGGELDNMNVSDLSSAFFLLLDNGHRLFVLDLSDLEFIDSAGLGGLVALWERAIEKGCLVALGQVSPRVQDVLQITGLSCVLQPHATTDEALAAVREMVKAFPTREKRPQA